MNISMRLIKCINATNILPMKKTSTQSMAIMNAKKEDNKNFAPRKSTIDFIKQFARSYNYTAKLHPSLGGFIAN